MSAGPFSDATRLRAREVIESDTDAWTFDEWRRAAILLASAVVAVSGDLRREAPAEAKP